MNYLAHLFLSKGNPQEMVGNFIGDYVKGRTFYRTYPDEISLGILLHRHIDAFTDDHLIHKTAKGVIKPLYQRYAGVVTDVLYDYLLAKNFGRYASVSLERFEKECYQQLFHYYELLPARVQGFLPRMRKTNRLQSYAGLEGIYESLDIMANYSSLPDKTLPLSKALPGFIDEMEQQFFLFFDDLQNELPNLRAQSAAQLQTALRN